MNRDPQSSLSKTFSASKDKAMIGLAEVPVQSFISGMRYARVLEGDHGQVVIHLMNGCIHLLSYVIFQQPSDTMFIKLLWNFLFLMTVHLEFVC